MLDSNKRRGNAVFVKTAYLRGLGSIEKIRRRRFNTIDDDGAIVKTERIIKTYNAL